MGYPISSLFLVQRHSALMGGIMGGLFVLLSLSKIEKSCT